MVKKFILFFFLLFLSIYNRIIGSDLFVERFFFWVNKLFVWLKCSVGFWYFWVKEGSHAPKNGTPGLSKNFYYSGRINARITQKSSDKFQKDLKFHKKNSFILRKINKIDFLSKFAQFF